MNNKRSIAYTAQIAKAVHTGHKTQVLKIMDPQPYQILDCDMWFWQHGGTAHALPSPTLKARSAALLALWSACPYGRAGDKLTVCEPWRSIVEDRARTYYLQSNDTRTFNHWNKPETMPLWIAQSAILILSVSVQRLQDITNEDAIAHGIERTSIGYRDYELPANVMHGVPPRYSFETLWGSVHGPDSWNANPWVWKIEFKRVPA